jgi:hypothetical protein
LQANQVQNQIDMQTKLTDHLVALQGVTPERPYSIKHRLDLAKAYKRLGYPDLAVGDAYKALLLIDEVIEEGEYHEEALEAAKCDLITDRLDGLGFTTQKEDHPNPEDSAVSWARTDCSRIAYDSYSTNDDHYTVHS